jgi:N-acetyl-alpha-D-glucosaminyl L-malate synthase BshA
MKIGITCYPVQGGSGIVATELGAELAARGHQIHYISYQAPVRLRSCCPNIYFHQVEVMSYPLFKYPPYTLTLSAKMAEVAKRWKLDIFHVHYAIPHAVCGFLAKSVLGTKSPKLVTTLHGTDITLVGIDKSFSSITKFSIEVSDGVTAVSNFLARETTEKFKPSRKIEVIYNFVDTERFRPSTSSARKEEFAPEGEKILAHFSNFRPVKRIPDVIKIFNLVQKEIPARLLLIGDGPEASGALELVGQLGLSDKVTYLGSRSDVEDILPVADLFLIPTNTESFGLASLEALSCGVPVIGTNLGGLPEVVLDGECGYLEKLGEVEAMAGKALKLLRDEDLLNQFKESARRRAVDLFDAERMVPKYERFYERILAE